MKIRALIKWFENFLFSQLQVVVFLSWPWFYQTDLDLTLAHLDRCWLLLTGLLLAFMWRWSTESMNPLHYLLFLIEYLCWSHTPFSQIWWWGALCLSQSAGCSLMLIWEAERHSWASNTPKERTLASQKVMGLLYTLHINWPAYLQCEGRVWEMDCGGTDTQWFWVENDFTLLVNHSMNTAHV